MKTDGETGHSDQSLKPRRPKSREVTSRFLSPTSMAPAESGIPSPNRTLSPFRQKPRPSIDSTTRKHRSLEDSGFIRGLWPSSTPPTTRSSSDKKLGTLADHLGNDRLNDLIVGGKNDQNSENSMSLNRQRSCNEFSRFEKTEQGGKISKENHKPFFGGSMRYTGKLRFPGRSSTSSSKSSSSQPPALADEIVPGRFSVDENALRRTSFGRRSDTSQDSESECSDVCSGTSFGSPVIGKISSASYMASTASSRKSGIKIPSKYMHDLSTRSRRGTSDSNIPNPLSSDNSPKKSTINNAMKRANSLTTYGSATSKWALSPGRTGSPPMSVENKGKPLSFSSLKPPTKARGVGNLLSMGLDLFKSKKSSATSSSASPLGRGTAETVHQLRLQQNRLVQWRYANARADAVNKNISNQAESNLTYAWNSLTNLQHTMIQKKLQLEKEKLQMKLNFILHSQIKSLEAWGDMERQHLSAVSVTKDCLHSVICRVPLVEGAKMEPHSASIALRHASDLATSIQLMLSSSSPTAEKTVSILSELAEVVAREKALFEEFLELFETISALEPRLEEFLLLYTWQHTKVKGYGKIKQTIQERSLKCSTIQMKLLQQQQQQQIHQHEIA